MQHNGFHRRRAGGMAEAVGKQGREGTDLCGMLGAPRRKSSKNSSRSKQHTQQGCRPSPSNDQQHTSSTRLTSHSLPRPTAHLPNLSLPSPPLVPPSPTLAASGLFAAPPCLACPPLQPHLPPRPRPPGRCCLRHLQKGDNMEVWLQQLSGGRVSGQGQST